MPTIANDYRALISGFSWNPAGVLGQPITITYSFETVANPTWSAEVRASFEAFSEADKALTSAALQMWDEASGVEFVMAPAGTGQIRFAKYNLALMNIRGSGAAHYPNPTAGAFSTVMINTAEGQAAFGITNYLGLTPLLILHEIGHALGQKHPWEGDVTFDQNDRPATAMIGSSVVTAVDRDFMVYLYGPDQKAALNLAGDKYDNRLQGGSFGDTLSGQAGHDTIGGGPGVNYLRGDDGHDSIVGGSDFDDINGNMGDDTASGEGGNDWVVGGKDNDSLSGGADNDLVYGNLGNDTCDGGTGSDVIRGGQGNDVVGGGPGDDYVSGDRGDDTMTGGPCADIFHSFGEAGIDSVTDFNLAEGDRVLLDPGTTYTAMQSGADTVISMTGGGQIILVGASMSSLTGNWITVG